LSVRKKILVVDDDEVVIELLHMKLGTMYDVVSTNSPDRVVKLAREESPDLIICDIGMPEFDGADVSWALRNDRELNSIPFLYLTALASDMQGLGELGGRPAISKFCSTKELLAGIQKMLDA
jgi:CheY-like chemotaxis protein